MGIKMNSQKRFVADGLMVLLSVALSLTFPGVPLWGQSTPKPAPAFKPTKFKPACAKPSYPTPAPAQSPGIDAICGLPGAGTGPEGQQNMAKNNFCATGSPQAITIPDLTFMANKVQAIHFIPFETLLTAVALYWVMCLAVERVAQTLETVAAVRGHE